MRNTSEAGEIAARANAKEAETVRQAQKLTSKTKQLTASKDAKSQVGTAKARKGGGRGQ